MESLLSDSCSLLFRIVYRDIGGSDPERMAAPAVAEYVQNVFKDTCVKVRDNSTAGCLVDRQFLLVYQTG